MMSSPYERAELEHTLKDGITVQTICPLQNHNQACPLTTLIIPGFSTARDGQIHTSI